MSKTTNNATINSVLASAKLSAIRKACNNVASLSNNASKDDKTLVSALVNAIQDERHIVELRDTTSCIMFIRDEHNNVLFNVYDTFRIQFTTQQAQKYKKELLKDERFYTFDYKQKQFISAKSKDISDFIDLCKYCYKAIDASEKTSATKKDTSTSATKKEQLQVANK